MSKLDTVFKIGKLVVGALGIALPVAQKAIGDREMKNHVSEQFADIIGEIVDKKVSEAIANMKTE
jgi:hypothetical protein